MTKWLAAAVVVLACAMAPLFAPQVWTQHGAFPDAAVLAVMYLAVQGTAERAAVLGVAIGLVRGAWSPEPFGLDAALYGALGWSGAHLGRSVFEDRALVQMAAAAVGVVAVRCTAAAIAAATVVAPASTHGMSAARWSASTGLAAVATGLAAPLAFAALSATRSLAAFERRRARDV